jgi:hypothetical protein
MQNQPQIPGHVSMDQFNQMLILPESFAAKYKKNERTAFVKQTGRILKFLNRLFWLIQMI